MSSVCSGNYCKYGSGVVFREVLRGTLPIQWLAKQITGKCTEYNHSQMCIICFNCKSFYISAKKIRQFLQQYKQILQVRTNVIAEIEALGLLLYTDRKNAWIIACREFISYSTVLQNLYHHSLHNNALSVSTFKEYVLAGSVNNNNLPMLPLACNKDTDREVMEDVYWYIMYITNDPRIYTTKGECYQMVYSTVQTCLHVKGLPQELIDYIWNFVIAGTICPP